VSGWRSGIGRFVERVETRLDAQRQRLGVGAGGRAPRIEAYRGFGTADRALVRARVLRSPPVPPAGERDGVLLNLAAMIQRFEAEPVPGARVRVRFPGGEETVAADGEGFVECWIHPRPGLGPAAVWHRVWMELVDVAEGSPPVRAPVDVLVPPATAAFGVVSDLDDTVVRTGATSTLRMLRTVFLANARTRLPFPGVAAFYRALQRGAGGAAFNPVFYVSSSPWNLHDLISEFLVLRKIPLGPLLLRDWRLGAGEILPAEHGAHKLAAIRRILGLYPALPFLLVGDSGQEDPEIYHRVVHDHPDRIAAVYIRDVTRHAARTAAVRALAEEVAHAGSTLVLADDTLAAARHAAGRGWIAADALNDVEAEAAEDGRGG
jgi:phosphatidate phosphatase APP1